MKTTCLTLGIVALVLAAGAKETTFTGTGRWDASARWNNGVPGADDTAIISDSGTSVTADGLDVSFNTLKLGNAATHSVIYRQKDGTLTSGYLTTVGNSGAAATMELENVDVALNGYRLMVGYGGADARFAMTGGTLTQNLSDGLLTGVWSKKGVAEIVLSNVAWNVTAGDVKVGFGSIATSRVEIVGGRFVNAKELRLGANTKNYPNAGYGWNEMRVCDSVWTNSGSIYLPMAYTNNVSLLVSNTVFRSDTNILLAKPANTTGTLEFADCANLSFANPIQLAEGAGSHARLVLRNQSNVADFLANNISYKDGARSETWIELINSPYTPSDHWWIGTSKSCTHGVIIRDTTYQPPADTVAARGGLGNLVFSNATVNIFSGHLYASGDTAGSTGVLEIVDSKLTLWPNGNTEAWKNGASSPSYCVYVSNHEKSWGRLRISGGEIDVNTFMVPRKGYGEAIIENGADVTASSLWVGNMTGCNGILRISDTSRLYVPGKITICNQSSSTGRVEQTGGTIVYDASRSPASSGSDGKPAHVSIGGQTGGYGYWRISDGSFTVAHSNYDIRLGDTTGGNGTLELAGGMVCTPRIFKTDNTGIGTVLFDGGLFKVYASTRDDILNSYLTAEVREGGAIIDTDGSSKNISAVLAHDSRVGAAAKDGGLVKKGEGTLTLTATPTFTGDVRVEAGTLDISSTSFELGAGAVIGGGGTLVTPPGGVTVTGAFTLDPTNAPTLTVTGGSVTIGAGATVTVTDASLLNKKTSYKLYNATSTTGVPTLVGFPNGWEAKNNGTSLRIRYLRGMTIDFK